MKLKIGKINKMKENNTMNLLFPTVILVKDNILLNQIDSYKESILNYFKDNKTQKTFTGSKLENSYYKENDIFKNNIFNNLINEIYLNFNLFCKTLGYSDKQIARYKIKNIWANLIKKYDYHSVHTHATNGNAIVSGVFYVDAPKNAKIKFKNPYADYSVFEKPEGDNILNFDYFYYDCVPGRLILFKSNVFHGYDSHLNEQNKISIAFNFGE